MLDIIRSKGYIIDNMSFYIIELYWACVTSRTCSGQRQEFWMDQRQSLSLQRVNDMRFANEIRINYKQKKYPDYRDLLLLKRHTKYFLLSINLLFVNNSKGIVFILDGNEQSNAWRNKVIIGSKYCVIYNIICFNL